MRIFLARRIILLYTNNNIRVERVFQLRLSTFLFIIDSSLKTENRNEKMGGEKKRKEKIKTKWEIKKKKGRARTSYTIARESRRRWIQGAAWRDPLSYGHIRDFFRLYLLELVRGKGHRCFIELGYMIYDTAFRSRSISTTPCRGWLVTLNPVRGTRSFIQLFCRK